MSLAADQQAATPVAPAIPQGFGNGKCECAYLSFGYWTSTVTYTGTYRTGQTDQISTAPYVVGTVANPMMLPNTSSATYTGFMAGMAQLGTNNPYFATGDMTINWSYNRGSGSVVGTWDNKAYSGNLQVAPGPPSANVTGSINLTASPSVSGPLTGSFFSSPTDPAKYIAGAFGVSGNVSGTPYKAGGIFATQR